MSYERTVNPAYLDSLQSTIRIILYLISIRGTFCSDFTLCVDFKCVNQPLFY